MFNGYAALLLLFLIFLFIFQQTSDLFLEVSISELLYSIKTFADGSEVVVFEWYPTSDNERLSLVPLLMGTFLTAIPATLFSTIIGVIVGIYLSEIAGDRLREFLKPVIEFFAGLPTVVIGFFLLFVAASLFQGLFGFISRLNAFVAAMGLSVIIIPVIATITEDVMRAVPRELRLESYALGATKWQTISRVVIPFSLKGISAAALIGFGRAIGETMIVLMASGNAAVFSVDVFGSVRTMTATIAAEMGEVAYEGQHYHLLFFIGLILLSSTFILNLIATIILRKVTQKHRK